MSLAQLLLEAGIRPAMLPGFRFLFAAILLSVSILVFGVGAAALLRATHEEFVANPSWRNGPQEQVFAQPAQPVLAALRTEPIATEPVPSLRDQIPTVGLPADVVELTATTSSDQAGATAVQVSDPPAAEAPAEESSKLAALAAPAVEPSVAQPAETKPAVIEARPATPEPAVSVAAQPQPAAPSLAPPPTEPVAAKVVALADPAAVTEKAPPAAKVKVTHAEPDKPTKRRAHRPAKKRHRIVSRPPQPPVQQTFDPFAQQQPAFATTATTRAR